MRRALSLLAVISVVQSCKEPTQLVVERVVEARTNVAHRNGMTTSFTIGSPGQT